MNQPSIKVIHNQAFLDMSAKIESREFTHYTISSNFVMVKNPFTRGVNQPPYDSSWNKFECFRQAHEIRKLGTWPIGLSECNKDEVMLIGYPKQPRIKQIPTLNITFNVMGAIYIGKNNLPTTIL